MLNAPAREKYDGFASFKKLFGQALAITPYIVEILQGAGAQLQFAILCAERRECNCLPGQVNGHKATLYFTLSTTCLGTCPR